MRFIALPYDGKSEDRKRVERLSSNLTALGIVFRTRLVRISGQKTQIEFFLIPEAYQKTQTKTQNSTTEI